jgi:hypothetical protein
MDTELLHVEFQEKEKRILVTVSYRERVGEVWNSANASVFIDWTDSYTEMKRLALEKAKAFLQRVVSAR